jgi:hypothetical protein
MQKYRHDQQQRRIVGSGGGGVGGHYGIYVVLVGVGGTFVENLPRQWASHVKLLIPMKAVMGSNPG